MNIEGEDIEKTVSLNLREAQPDPRERLRAAGLTVVPLGDELTISNVGFGTPAQRALLEPGFAVTAVVAPAPDRPSAMWVYLPAFVLLSLIWWNQRRRTRSGTAGAAEPVVPFPATRHAPPPA
jgi:hypothetical protein